MSIAVCIAAGLVAGFAGGLFGISGGAIIVPTLVLGLAFSQHKAQGTSLAALSLPVAGLGAYNYYAKGQLDLSLGLLLAVGFALGHVFGSKIAHSLDGVTMRRTFAAFLATLAVYLFFKSSMPQGASVADTSSFTLVSWGVVLAAGTFAGALGGLFGFGGGIVSVPILVMALGLQQHFAQGCALFALTLPVTAISAIHYHREGNVDKRKVVPLAIGVFAGGLFGSALALLLDQVVMQQAFACFLVAMSLYLFFRKNSDQTLGTAP